MSEVVWQVRFEAPVAAGALAADPHRPLVAAVLAEGADGALGPAAEAARAAGAGALEVPAGRAGELAGLGLPLIGAVADPAAVRDAPIEALSALRVAAVDPELVAAALATALPVVAPVDGLDATGPCAAVVTCDVGSVVGPGATAALQRITNLCAAGRPVATSLPPGTPVDGAALGALALAASLGARLLRVPIESVPAARRTADVVAAVAEARR